jgi:hypothetical protein
MSVQEKADFLIAVRNYESGKTKRWTNGKDVVASGRSTGEKVLIRLTETQTKPNLVGIDEVKNMLKVMTREGCKRGVFISKKFTDAAIEEMGTFNIQQFSDEYMPPVTSENIVLAINDCRNNLCKIRCGEISSGTSACKNRQEKNICRIKSISDDAVFHCKRGWMNLLKNDLRQLLLLNKTVSV